WWRIQPAPSEVRWVSKDAIGNSNAVVSNSPPDPNNKPVSSLWMQAEQAETTGNLGQAEALYRQLAAEQSGPGGNQELAIRCWNRIELMRQRSANATLAARAPGSVPGTLSSSGSSSQRVNNPPPPTGNLTSSPSGPVTTSGPGWLRRASFQIDGKQVYVLEDVRGQP